MTNSKPVIVLTGAGSGGHITPLLAVADELKFKLPESHIVYIGQKGDKLGDLPAQHASIDEVYSVRAGKFRRYHGEGLKQLLDLPTFLKNCRDALYVIIGLFQSRQLLGRLKPDVVFVKGGYVGVPVGLAAANLKIPYVTHDSDAIPGLANKIIAKWAAVHAVAMPKEMYNYPSDKTVMTGIPLQKEFQLVDDALKSHYRQEVGIPDAAKVLFVIGGGLGSQRINQAVIDSMPGLLKTFPNLYVLHATGLANDQSVKDSYAAKLTEDELKRLKTYGYLSDVYRYSGAADLIITRAGATNLAEFAVQGRACLVIPSPFLAGGHQLKNADILEKEGAIAVLPEDQLLSGHNLLSLKVSDLIRDDNKLESLGSSFKALAIQNGAERLAEVLLEQIKK